MQGSDQPGREITPTLSYEICKCDGPDQQSGMHQPHATNYEPQYLSDHVLIPHLFWKGRTQGRYEKSKFN